MKKCICLFLLFYARQLCCFSQTTHSGNVLENLYFNNHEIATIKWDEYPYVNPVDPKEKRFETFPQALLRNRKGLFAAINGTGRLYKAVRNNQQISFERLDSTFYFGNNFRSLIFSYKDTIYSLGGYGFWKANGLLRYYSEARKEWENVPLNAEIPLLTDNKFDLIWFDQRLGKVYFGFICRENSVTNEKGKSPYDFECYVLDVDTKRWEKLGSLDNDLRNNLVDITNFTSGYLGQLIGFKDNLLLLNYSENRIYELKAETRDRIVRSPAFNDPISSLFFRDSILYIGVMKKSLLDSFVITKDNLISTDRRIYYIEANENSKNSGFASFLSPNFLIVIISTFFLILVSILIFKKRNIFETTNRKKLKEILPSNPNNFNVFSQLEADVVKFIAENSGKGIMTSIIELNRILGVSKKSTELQKKQRSDIIMSINKKYSLINRKSKEIIQKRRTDFDKRTFEYFIDPEYQIEIMKSFRQDFGSDAQ
ncbi:MAG: hypothetical protein C5B52_15440 [Bacteroidetes bacterium]|nr:MAG: hypothetical protein C5B52_15440 [Bacteroidota bacterium]